MITVACCLWGANAKSLPFSRHYTESDVEKLYRGFARHLSVPFRFVCFTERNRVFCEDIAQERLSEVMPGYGAMIEPFRLNEPTILCGLDTIVVGNCDHLAAYCIGASVPAVPRDPFFPEKTCNGVALVPAGQERVWREFPGGNDMDWTRQQAQQQSWALIDDLFPGQVVSFKGEIAKHGLSDETRIVYFHGKAKPHELPHVGWIARHWHDNVKVAA